MRSLAPAAVAFGGLNALSGVSTSRTLMLTELRAVLEVVPIEAPAAAYRAAVIDENVTLKPSAGTRSKTYSYLRDRFGLDPELTLFRVLRLFWARDEAGQPLLALLVAAARDPLLRSTLPVILDAAPGQVVTSRDFVPVIADVTNALDRRLGPTTLTSSSENTTSSYKQSGHLRGRRNCQRQLVTATPGSAALALLLATLDGNAGLRLLDSPWVQLLDQPGELILTEARVAASRGWLELRHAGGVLEITFRQLLAAIDAEGADELR